jgi:hypothetical protein
VGGDDLREEGLAGLEVVVVAVHTHLDEVVDLTRESMPREAATLMSTAARIAATPSRICSMSLSSGPRTAATMQNSLAPVRRSAWRRARARGC